MFSTKPTSINRSPPRLLLLHSTDIKHMQAPEERFLYKVLFFFSIEPSISFCIPSPLSSVSCVDPSNPLFPGQSKCNNFPLSHVACGASLPFAWLAGWLGELSPPVRCYRKHYFHIYTRGHHHYHSQSVRPSVRPSIHPSIHPTREEGRSER